MTFGLILVFMFLVFWRPQDWLVPWLYGFPMLDVIFYASLLCMLMELQQGRIRIRRDMPQPFLLAGLFVATLLSHVAHTYFQGVIQTFPEIFKLCFFTLVLHTVLDKESRLRAVAWLFVAMASVMAVHCLMQQQYGSGFAGGRPLWIPPMNNNPGHFRSQFFGIFEDPNDTAQLMATAIPFAFALTRRRSFTSFLMGAAITWLLVEGVLSTHSRGGLVALTVVGSLMTVLVLPDRWFPAGMIGLLVGFILLCPFMGAKLDMSAQERVVFWGMANAQFKQNLLCGVGYGMFWQVASGRAAHNLFVLCYTEVGILGYWFWFGLLSLGIAGAWRVRQVLSRRGDLEEQWLRRFCGLAMTSLTAFCASGYFLSRSFVYPLFFLFAVAGAIPNVARRWRPAGVPWYMDVGRDMLVNALPASLISVIYIYFTIILLNKAFYGG